MSETNPLTAATCEREAVAIRDGRLTKRKNAITAVLCGMLPTALLGFYSTVPWTRWLTGVFVGIICGNAFEYVYHRWLLHHARNPLGQGHREHHARIGTPDAAQYVALASSPKNVVLMFAVNGIPAVLIALLTGLWGVLSGVFVGWMFYLIVTEEIHWRIHMNSWLPIGLRAARDYHMSHHAVPTSRYNVFLPICDFLLGSSDARKRKAPV